MGAPTDAGATGRRPEPAGYGTSSPALRARADRGLATRDHPSALGSETDLPLDRETHRRLMAAVLSRGGIEPVMGQDDCRQAALQLTGAARLLAEDVRRAADRLPTQHPARALADYVLEETDRHLAAPWRTRRSAPRAAPGWSAPCTSAWTGWKASPPSR